MVRKPGEAGDSGGGPVRTMIVDDAQLIIDVVSRYLASWGGFEVVATAFDGREALAKAASVSPQLVIMDVEMPHMDGIAATRELRRLPSPPRVVLMSLSDDPARRAAALSAGAAGYCDKLRLQDELPRLITQA